MKFIPGVTRGAELEAAVNALEDGQVLLVENTRFEDVDGRKNLKTILNLVNTGHHLEMYLRKRCIRYCSCTRILTLVFLQTLKKRCWFPAKTIAEARAVIEGQDLQVGEEKEKSTVIR